MMIIIIMIMIIMQFIDYLSSALVYSFLLYSTESYTKTHTSLEFQSMAVLLLYQ